MRLTRKRLDYVLEQVAKRLNVNISIEEISMTKPRLYRIVGWKKPEFGSQTNFSMDAYKINEIYHYLMGFLHLEDNINRYKDELKEFGEN